MRWRRPWVLLCCLAAIGSTAHLIADERDDLVGVVLDEAGAPAPGATVTAAGVHVQPPLRLTTSTDPEGRFRIKLPPLTEHRIFSLAVRWNGQGAELMNGVDPSGKAVSFQGQPLPPQTIRLRTGGKLVGRVLRAEDGWPIEGARLFLDTGEVLTTNRLGRFEIDGLSLKDHCLIPAVPERLRSYVLFDMTKRPDAELEIRLPRGAVVHGRVTDGEGQPIVGAYLSRSGSGTALTLNGWDELCQPDGSFRYGGLAEERTHVLRAQAPGYESTEIRAEVHAIDDALERTVVLRKSPAPPAPELRPVAENDSDPAAAILRKTIEGIVRSPEGMPVKGARIRWGRYPYDQSVQDARSDDTGAYRITDVPDGDGALLVTAQGFAPQFLPVTKGTRRENARLSRGVPVRGVVLSSAGTPVPGVLVIPTTYCTATGLCNPIWFEQLQTRTDAKGEFLIPNVAPEFGFDFLRDDFSERRGVKLQAGDVLNEVRLSARGVVAGLVLDERGHPARNFNVRVQIPRERAANEAVGGFYAGFHWYGISFTRDDGTFVLSGVNAGSWLRLVVTAPGVGQAVIDRAQAASLDRLEAPERLTFRLKPFAPLSVRVEEEKSGRAVANAVVTLVGEAQRATGPFTWEIDDRGLERKKTNGEGRVRFEEPGAEDGAITVRAPGFAPRRVAWLDGARDVTIPLQPGATLAGAIRLKGKPVVYGYVQLLFADGTVHHRVLADTPGLWKGSAADGRFKFDDLPTGNLTLKIYDDSRELHSRGLKLGPGETRLEPIEIWEAVDGKASPSTLLEDVLKLYGPGRRK